MTIFLDNLGNIGLEVAILIGQSAPVELTAINSNDLPDAFWLGQDGQSHGYEIKQPGELLGRLSDVEEQLSRQYRQVDHLGICIAGVVVPQASGCKILQWSADGKVGYLAGVKGGGVYNQDYTAFRGKLRAWEAWGITVTELPTKLALAQHLVECYLYDQKPPEAHHTFRQPIRTKKPMGDWSAYVLTTMSLYDPATGRTFLGPDKATALMDYFGSPEMMISAPLAEMAKVPGIGKLTAEKIKRAVGLG